MALALKSAMIGASVAAVATAAVAADMPRGAPYDLPPPANLHPTSMAAFPSLYVRGDFAYRWSRIGGADPASGFPAPANGKLGDAYSAGLGVGIRSDWLRVDATIDSATAMKYQSTTTVPNDTTASISAITAMANGYLDLATWYGVTPYVGAGVGGARLAISSYQSTVTPPFGGDASHSQWNIAWAAMGGVAYKIAANIQLDVGYRYLALGNVATASGTSGALTLKNIANHEVRVGLRWNIDDLPVSR